MIKSYKKINAFFLIIAQIIFVFSTNFIFFAKTSQAENLASKVSSYTVQLKDLQNYGDLVNVGTNIKHLFTWQKSPEFLNIYSFSSSLSESELKTKLSGGFVYLEPNFKTTAAAAVFLNDPGFTQNPLDIDKEWGLAKAQFPQAWQTVVGSRLNAVAIIDTGIDETHEDLQNINYLNGFDFIHNKSIIPYTNSDDNGHGTLVTGVLAASPNNGIGIVGTNWQISVLPVKALDSTGKGDASTLAQAIVWATDQGAIVLNLSVGGIGFGHDTTLSSAISYAFNHGAVIVAAAGNDMNQVGDNLDNNPVYPICDDNNQNMIIGVAATDQNDLKADFSNYGKNCIDVSAPGKRILSTISFDPITKKAMPNSYAYGSGTSLAVPFVVGQAALIKAAYPNATNIQIRDRIISGADKIDNMNLSQCAGGSCAGFLGVGRINVVKSLAPNLLPAFAEGDLVKLNDGSGTIYQISGGQKRIVSPFVYDQKFLNSQLKNASPADLASFPQGAYVTPTDGTLVKMANSKTTYYIVNGQKMPVTQTVFKQRSFSFNDVKTVSFAELNSWPPGNFLAPLDGTVIRSARKRTIYWVVGQVLHQVSPQYYKDKGLKIFPILTLPDSEIKGYAQGEVYSK